MTTYAHPSLVTDTGLIRMFPNSNNLGNPMRSAANVLGHFSLLVTAVAGVFYTTIASILKSDELLASGPAITASWVLLVFVGAGIVMTSYRCFFYGLGYAFGALLAMVAGGHLFEAASATGWTYHGIGATLLSVFAMAFIAEV